MKRTPLSRRTPLRAIGKRSRLRDKEWKVNRALAMERAGGVCEYDSAVHHPRHDFGSWRCSARAVHVHHRLPTSAGGKHDLANLRALCVEHHDFIHIHPTVSYENGWLISRYGRTE
jgi:5-methylcytosine-specific restriction endonuclease McrA